MLRICCGLALLSLVVSSLGCAMCANCNDCCYGATGGTHPRGEPCCGRVASLFDPADGGVVSDEYYEGPATSPQPSPQPTPAATQPDNHRSVMRPNKQATYYR